MSHALLDDGRTALSVAEAYAGCARIARRKARNFYYAFLPLRPERRYALYALYSFARLADDLADAEGYGLEERIALLEQLRERLEESLDGSPRGTVFVGLADAVRRFDIPKHALNELITGVRQDLDVRRYATYEELCDYCYLVAGTVGLACAAIFEASGEEAHRYAVQQGLGMQLVNIMRDVREDAGADRIYLPQDLLERYGVTEEEIVSGRVGEGWTALMRELGRRARAALEEGACLLPLVAPDARVCPALLRDLYEAILDRIEAVKYDVFTSEPDLSFLRKIRIMLSTWRRFRAVR